MNILSVKFKTLFFQFQYIIIIIMYSHRRLVTLKTGGTQLKINSGVFKISISERHSAKIYSTITFENF